jgi:transcription initiation factor TFIIIB Brf1 subunit/transcription initiation factor TFIIB
MNCPKCGKAKGYRRIKTNEWVCQDCGEITKFEEE